MEKERPEASDESGPGIFRSGRVRGLQEIQEFLRRSGHRRWPRSSEVLFQKLLRFPANLPRRPTDASSRFPAWPQATRGLRFDSGTLLGNAMARREQRLAGHRVCQHQSLGARKNALHRTLGDSGSPSIRNLHWGRSPRSQHSVTGGPVISSTTPGPGRRPGDASGHRRERAGVSLELYTLAPCAGSRHLRRGCAARRRRRRPDRPDPLVRPP